MKLVDNTPSQFEQLASQLRDCGANLVPVQHAASHSELRSRFNGDLRKAVCMSLESPVDFPPLERCTVPGDRVAIAIDESVPRLLEIVAGTIDAFETAGVGGDAISVVIRESHCTTDLAQQLGELGHQSTRIVIHEPNSEAQLCFVGSLQNGQPLLINRTLFEADVIFPIGCTRLDEVVGAAGVFGSLYPRFADAETIRRWRMIDVLDSDQHARWRNEAEEAGWLIGAPFVMEVVPGPRGSAARVVAGEARAVVQESLATCRELWSCQVSQTASLVIATIDDGHPTQSWENVARAVGAAQGVLQDDGALAICSPPLESPSKSLQRLAAAEPADVLRQLRHDAERDTWSAWQLAQARLRGPVYLLGGLDMEVTEELGLAPVSDFAELTRLASRHESCILLEDSHQCVVTTSE